MSHFNIFDHQSVAYVVSTMGDGNIDTRFGTSDQVANNLAAICAQAQIDPASIIQMEQVHQAHVTRVDCSSDGQVVPGADGLLTNDPRVTLMLRLADCVPVLIYDPETHAIGLVHSGWRGSIGKITLVAIHQMMREFGSRPTDLRLALGPSIQPASNIWTQPPWQQQLPEWQPFIGQKDNQSVVDLPGFIKATAVAAGVPEDNIEVSSEDTVSSEHYFSHTRSQKSGESEGRFAVLFKLNPLS